VEAAAIRKLAAHEIPGKRAPALLDDRAEQGPRCDGRGDAIASEFGGDHRVAIRAPLHDLTDLAMLSEAAVSRGYVRGCC
jgi:hypothetical protein